jgi:hypothetical protein
VLTSKIQKLAKAGILAATLALAAPLPEGARPLSAYYESASIQFVPEAAAAKTASAAFGPWLFGARLRDGKPLDKRLNLYVIIPGHQYHSSNSPEYDHNLVVNALTHEKGRDWDIFWCFILDPRLETDFRSEHDLLNAAQQSFVPPDLFDTEDIPSQEALREKTGIDSMADLQRYRHRDGSLPRILILPAHIAVSATAERPELPDDAKQ